MIFGGGGRENRGAGEGCRGRPEGALPRRRGREAHWKGWMGGRGPYHEGGAAGREGGEWVSAKQAREGENSPVAATAAAGCPAARKSCSARTRQAR